MSLILPPTVAANRPADLWIEGRTVNGRREAPARHRDAALSGQITVRGLMIITSTLAVISLAFVPALRTGRPADWTLGTLTALFNLPLVARIVLTCTREEEPWMQGLDPLIVSLFPFGAFSLFFAIFRLSELGALS